MAAINQKKKEKLIWPENGYCWLFSVSFSPRAANKLLEDNYVWLLFNWFEYVIGDVKMHSF